MGKVSFALAVVLGMVAWSTSAWAYPQFQFSTGATRCNQCHYAPAGGGLINNYGREEAGDTISAGGDGSFLHGAWDPPKWLALGADLRSAALINDVGTTDGAELAAFPMQADLYTRLAAGAFSFNLIVGYRGSPRQRDSIPLSFAVSREHYLMWRPKPQGAYVRVGRFFAPLGLRLAEHPSFTRRYTGFHTLEETYGVSGGFIRNGWEMHATAFVPDFLRPVGQKGKGAAVFFEQRILDGKASWGAQARASLATIDGRYTAGVIGKYYLGSAKLLFMAELDYTRQLIRPNEGASFSGAAPIDQVVTHASVTWFPKQSWMIGGGWERFDENLSLKGVARDAFTVQANWFFYAHLELSLYTRLQILGGGSGGDAARLAMIQLHYYL